MYNGDEATVTFDFRFQPHRDFMSDSAARGGVSVNVPQFSLPPVEVVSQVSVTTTSSSGAEASGSHPQQKRRTVNLPDECREWLVGKFVAGVCWTAWPRGREVSVGGLRPSSSDHMICFLLRKRFYNLFIGHVFRDGLTLRLPHKTRFPTSCKLHIKPSLYRRIFLLDFEINYRLHFPRLTYLTTRLDAWTSTGGRRVTWRM